MVDRQLSGALPLFVRECDEKIAKLEAELQDCAHRLMLETKECSNLIDENQRLRDALEEIAIGVDEFEHIDDAAMFAKQALEDSATK